MTSIPSVEEQLKNLTQSADPQVHAQTLGGILRAPSITISIVTSPFMQEPSIHAVNANGNPVPDQLLYNVLSATLQSLANKQFQRNETASKQTPNTEEDPIAP